MQLRDEHIPVSQTSRLTEWLGVCLALLMPGSALWPLDHVFALDWINHLWLLEYTGNHFRTYGAFPEVIDTPTLAGMPFPTFYGMLFYPVLGCACGWIDAALMVRAAVFGLFALQFFAVRGVVRRLGGTRQLAWTAACLNLWTIYPLTNLYHRGALTEFFAAGLLVVAVCRWFDFLLARTSWARYGAALSLAWWFTLAAGAHPITALLGGLFLVGLSSTAWLGTQPRLAMARMAALALAGIPFLLALSPWLYALACFRTDLDISQNQRLWYFLSSLDNCLVRLAPVPLDVRTWRKPLSEVSSPYLDTQINIPLLLLLGLMLRQSWGQGALWRRSLALNVVLLVTVGLLLASLMPWFSLVLPLIVQFAYRLVTYINLGLLAALLLVVLERARQNVPLPRLPLVRLVLLAGLAVLLKQERALEVGLPQRIDLSDLPASFYGAGNYATPRLIPQLSSSELAVAPFVPIEFGTTGGGAARLVSISHSEPGFVRTKIQAFPWNTVLIDGSPVPKSDIRSWLEQWHGQTPGLPTTNIDSHNLAIWTPAGDHTLEYRWQPAPPLRLLRALSFLTLALFGGGLLCSRIVRFLRNARRRHVASTRGPLFSDGGLKVPKFAAWPSAASLVHPTSSAGGAKS